MEIFILHGVRMSERQRVSDPRIKISRYHAQLQDVTGHVQKYMDVFLCPRIVKQLTARQLFIYYPSEGYVPSHSL